MLFSLDSIKNEVSAFYHSHKPLFKQAGADALYGALALGALLPIAAAAQQGDWAVGVAISNLLGNIGANLISNLLQRGKDTVDAQVAREVQALARQEPELRQKLDAILMELKAADTAALTLDEPARPDFIARLEAAMKQAGSTLTISVGNITSNTNSPMNLGSGTQTTTYNIDNQRIHLPPDPEAQKRAAMDEARQRYLTHLRKFCQNLPLAALGGDEGSELGVTLEDVYIELDTTAFFEIEEKPNPAHPQRAQIINNPKLLELLGFQIACRYRAGLSITASASKCAFPQSMKGFATLICDIGHRQCPVRTGRRTS